MTDSKVKVRLEAAARISFTPSMSWPILPGPIPEGFRLSCETIMTRARLGPHSGFTTRWKGMAAIVQPESAFVLGKVPKNQLSLLVIP